MSLEKQELPRFMKFIAKLKNNFRSGTYPSFGNFGNQKKDTFDIITNQ